MCHRYGVHGRADREIPQPFDETHQMRCEAEGQHVEETITGGDPARGIGLRQAAPGWPVQGPRPGAPVGAHQLQIAGHEEGADVHERRAAQQQERAEDAEERRTAGVQALGEDHTPQRPGRADEERDPGDRGAIAFEQQRARQHHRREVDHAVPRRDIGRHVVEAIGVDVIQRREGVLADRGRQHRDRDLHPDGDGLPRQERHEKAPGAGAEKVLAEEIPTQGARIAIEIQAEADAEDHDPGVGEVATAPPQHHTELVQCARTRRDQTNHLQSSQARCVRRNAAVRRQASAAASGS